MSGRPVERAATGALMGLAWLAGLYAASPLLGGFAALDLAQAIVFLSPGWLAAVTVDLLGFFAKPALVIGVAGAVVIACGLLRVLWHRLPDLHPAVPVLLGCLATAAVVSVARPGSLPAAVGGVVVAVVPPFLVARYVRDSESPAGRRTFLRRAGSIAAAGAVSLGALRVGLERVLEPNSESDDGNRDDDVEPSSRDGDVDVPTVGDDGSGEATPELPAEPGATLPRDVSPPRGDASFSFGRMPPAVTPPEDHYVVDINVEAPVVGSNKPEIDAADWTLDVEGRVSQSYSLPYDELVTHPASVEQTMTMICISNRVGGDLIGTSHWTGVQLSDLVGDADPTEGAETVVTHAADGYSEAIPLDLIEREDILIAYGMGERTLSRAHGFPARLLIPGRYGMKMTKWIDRIELLDGDHESHYEARGWDGEGIVNTMSYFRGFRRDDDRVTVGGVAFGGLETGVQEIDRVEVSLDGGETWNDAELEDPIAVHARRRFKYEFDSPERTEYEFVCRAVRRDGTVQTSRRTDPHPSGATGWHRVTRPI